MLHAILELQHSKRAKLIKQFQEEVWYDEATQDEKLNEILSEIAHDLDFYEPDEEERNKEPSFYGDDRLTLEIKSAIQKLSQQIQK